MSESIVSTDHLIQCLDELSRHSRAARADFSGLALIWEKGNIDNLLARYEAALTAKGLPKSTVGRLCDELRTALKRINGLLDAVDGTFKALDNEASVGVNSALEAVKLARDANAPDFRV